MLWCDKRLPSSSPNASCGLIPRPAWPGNCRGQLTGDSREYWQLHQANQTPYFITRTDNKRSENKSYMFLVVTVQQSISYNVFHYIIKYNNRQWDIAQWSTPSRYHSPFYINQPTCYLLYVLPSHKLPGPCGILFSSLSDPNTDDQSLTHADLACLTSIRQGLRKIDQAHFDLH